MALLSFWQNSSASDHFLGGKCGRERESSEQTCIAQAVRPAVSRGFVRPKTCAVGCLCPGYRLSSRLRDVAAQPCRGRVTRTSLQAFKPLGFGSPTCAVPCLERSQLHLRQTAHALSSNVDRCAGTA